MDIKIVYTGPVTDDVRDGASIFRFFAPENSYIDSAPYVDGHKVGVAVGDTAAGTEVYGKSVYASNVDGFGIMKGLKPIASAPIKLAYLERAVMAANEAKANGTENKGITVTIKDDDAQEKLYWEQLAPNYAEYGFQITVGAAAGGTAE